MRDLRRRSPRRAALRRQAGFTLLELLIVLTIMAGVTAVVTIALNGPRAGLAFRTTHDTFLSELRMARSEATAKGGESVVTIDPQGRWFQREGGTRHTIPEGIDLTIVSAVEAAEGSAAIRFFPGGEATGGQIRLESRSAAVGILVHWRTGLVLLPESDHAR